MSECKQVDTPGAIEAVDTEYFETTEMMDPVEAARYRRTAAKLKYASLDNPAIAFAAKEAA